jgi:hypothetical protein
MNQEQTETKDHLLRIEKASFAEALKFWLKLGFISLRWSGGADCDNAQRAGRTQKMG